MRLYYGWYILAASVVIELFGLGFGIFAVTTVYPYIIDTFPDWSRTTVFLATSVIIGTVGVMSPITGAYIDRFPIRRLFVAGIVVQSAAVYYFSTIQTSTEYIVCAVFIGLGLSGVTVLPNQVLVSRWFRSRIGLVNGIILASTATGAALAPPLITRIIEATDWRTAFQLMAVLTFVAPMLVVLFVVRDRPEDLGLEAYGAAEAPTDDGTGGATIGTALRSRTFWLLGGAIFFGGIPCYSYNKHILVFLKELGFDPVSAADYKGLLFGISACARLSFGWLCDRFPRHRVTALHFALIACGYPILLLVPERPELLPVSLLIFGVGYGGLLPTIPIMSVHYFGRRHLGKVLGAYKVLYDLSAGGAPLLTAWLYDRSGGYFLPQSVNSLFAWAGFLLVAVGLRHARAVSTLTPHHPGPTRLP